MTTTDGKRMKIAFLISRLDYGGAERQMLVLATELHRRGHEVRVLVFYRGGDLEPALHEAGVPVHVLDKGHRWDIGPFMLRLYRVLRAERPDVLHGYLCTPNIVASAIRPLLPRMKVVWGERASDMDVNQFGWVSRVSSEVANRLSHYADLIIVNSHAGLRYITSVGFPERTSVVIPNGLDTDLFAPDREAGRRLRAEWGVSDSEKLVGLVGRIDPMKDHPTFIEAAGIVAAERDDVRFVCVGNGPEQYRREMRLLAEQRGVGDRMLWVNARSDVASVYNALDVMSACSSYGEGFPNVVGEAMACGVPCVVSDVGDAAWLLGQPSLVVPRRAPTELAARLSMLLAADECELARLRAAGRERALTFSIGALTDRTAQALRTVVAGVAR